MQVGRRDGHPAHPRSLLLSREALLEALRTTRERGYAISDEDVTPGIGAVGAPIFDHTGAVRASLSFGGMRDAVFTDAGRSIELLCGGAAEVSRTLGYDAARPAAQRVP